MKKTKKTKKKQCKKICEKEGNMKNKERKGEGK